MRIFLLAARSLTLTAALLFVCTSIASAVPLLPPLMPGPGDGSLPENDDSSSDAISLEAAFPGGLTFFGGPYTEMWVNTNGNITFNGSLSTYTPNPFPVATQPMIAPYWADVDTRGGGRPTRNSVFWHLEPGRMQVTWHDVGYYNTNDDLVMDFQLIVTNALGCGLGDFDVEFRYNRCEWETGDASDGTNGFGGTQAQAGFDAGNSTDFVEIPGSRAAGIANTLCTGSNVDEPGIWRFGVRGGGVVCPGTGSTCTAATGVGACATGITQCVGRDTVCSPIGEPSEERCDNIDNDCNGTVDDGELCEDFELCVEGACVPPCFEGSCSSGFSCDELSVCVEDACMDVNCPDGQRCSGGECVDSCDSVICPHNQQCIAGRCADLCDILTCGAEEVCFDGSCVPKCPCRTCPDGETCLADGSCESMGCDIVTCETGTYCEAGACLDSCAGAVCPEGQTCSMGSCLAGEGPPPGMDSGVVDTDGGPGVDGGVIPGARGGRGGGCGCDVPGEPAGSGALFWGLVLLATSRLRRGRRS